MDDESFAFAIERHNVPYFGRSASKRSLVVGSALEELRLERSGGMEARALFDDDEDNDAMVKIFLSCLAERLLGIGSRGAIDKGPTTTTP